MHLYLLREHFDPHARVLRKGDRKEANVSCLDWTIQCVLYNGIQVGIRLEDLFNQLILIYIPTDFINRKRQLVAFNKRTIFLPLRRHCADCTNCSHINLDVVISDRISLLTPTQTSMEPSHFWIIIKIIGTGGDSVVRYFVWVFHSYSGTSSSVCPLSHIESVFILYKILRFFFLCFVIQLTYSTRFDVIVALTCEFTVAKHQTFVRILYPSRFIGVTSESFSTQLGHTEVHQ